MRWRLFTLLAVLALMVSTASPVNAQAQIAEDILGLMEIENNETAEMSWIRKPQPAKTQGSIKVPFIYKVQQVSPRATGICAATIQDPLETSSGFNALNLSMGPDNESLLVNGKPLPLFEPCLKDAKRLVLLVGRKGPPGAAQSIAVDPTASQPLGMQDVWVTWTTIGPNGETRAASTRGRVIPKLGIASTASY